MDDCKNDNGGLRHLPHAIPHQALLAAAYVLAGIGFAAAFLIDFKSFLDAHPDFLGAAPRWVNNAIIALMLTVPFSFVAAGLMLYRRSNRWIVLGVAALGTSFVPGPGTIALAAYLVWCLVLQQSGDLDTDTDD